MGSEMCIRDSDTTMGATEASDSDTRGLVAQEELVTLLAQICASSPLANNRISLLCGGPGEHLCPTVEEVLLSSEHLGHPQTQTLPMCTKFQLREIVCTTFLGGALLPPRPATNVSLHHQVRFNAYATTNTGECGAFMLTAFMNHAGDARSTERVVENGGAVLLPRREQLLQVHSPHLFGSDVRQA